MESQSLYLVHHGIKGMKWGERNGPPYPLGVSQKSYREKKHIESDGHRLPKDFSNGKAGASKSQKRLRHRDKLIAKYREQGMSQKEAEAAAARRISIEKKVAVGTAVAVGAIAAYGAYRYLGNSAPVDGKTFGGVNISRHVNLDSQLMRKQFEASDFEKQINNDLHKINRGGWFGHLFLEGREVNCTSCSMAYEMRRRGYDVIADRRYGSGRTNEQVEALFQNAHFNNLFNTSSASFGLRTRPNKATLDMAVQSLASQGEGARGFIHGWFLGGGGHSIAYEVHNGKVYFVDGQIGRQYKDAAEALGQMWGVDFLRTDNLAFTNDAADAVINNTKASILSERPSEFAVEVSALTALTVGSVPVALKADEISDKVVYKSNKAIRNARSSKSSKKR